MKNVKNFLIMVVIMMTLAACGDGQDIKVYEEPVLEESIPEKEEKTPDILDKITDDSYWQREPQMRFIVKPEVVVTEEDDPSYPKSSYKLSAKDKKKLKKMDKAIVNCFMDYFEMDFSQKMKNVNINLYKTKDKELFIAGYSNEEVINLNELIFTDEKQLLETTYLHEAMHYIGIISTGNVNCIDEGLADHFAKIVAEYAGIPYNDDDNPYYWYNLVADQMCVVSEDEILYNYRYTEKFNICNYISEVVKDVSQPCLTVDNPGEFLADMLPAVGDETYDDVYGDRGFVLAFMSQDIVNAYCYQFNPTKDEIEKMRKLYMVMDIETMSILETEEGYFI